VRIQARANRIFSADVETDLHLAARDIYNVVVTATLIRFDAVVQPGTLQTILIRASSRSEARAIASHLPVAMTPEFAAESTRLDRFLDGMESRTPHVWVTWMLVALNVLVYVAMVALWRRISKNEWPDSARFRVQFWPRHAQWRMVAATRRDVHSFQSGAALFFQAVRSNSTPDARQELAFAAFEQQEAVAEQKAIKDTGAMLPMIHDLDQRAAIVVKIRTTVWPEWNALYEGLNNTVLPQGSRRAPLRAAQLRYYDDLRQAWLDLADEGTSCEDSNSGVNQKVKALLADAKVQRAMVAKLAARG
jgi:hypothetical protein